MKNFTVVNTFIAIIQSLTDTIGTGTKRLS